jgi:hypothetical protein
MRSYEPQCADVCDGFCVFMRSPCRLNAYTLVNGFFGRVVNLAPYETNVLGSKPPPGGLSTNPRLTFVLPLPCLFIRTHKPILNSCTCSCVHGVGPTCFSVRNRYLIPALPLHPCPVRWIVISDCPNAKLYSALISRDAGMKT